MQTLWFIFSGAIGGIIAGMGMGGGTLLIPILTLFLGVEQHLAQGVNLLSFIPMALVVIAIHSKNKLIKFKKIWLVSLFSAAGSVGGAFLSNIISSNLLSKLLGGFLCALAVFQFITLFISAKKQKQINL